MAPSKPPPNRTPVRRATLKDVARTVGVSPATVSNAYNRPDQLSATLRQRILDAARDLGYSGPDPQARGLRRGRTGAIGVVYADALSYAFTDPAAALFLQGVSAIAERAGLALLLLPAPRDPQAVMAAAVDGFVVYCLPDDSEALRAVVTRGLPCVLVEQGGDWSTAHDLPRVEIDDRTGARQAARHLLDLGHRRLGVLSLELNLPRRRGPVDAAREAGVTVRPTRDRLYGYRDAVREAGLEGEAELRVVEGWLNSPEEGERLALDLLGGPRPPTALLCMSDQLALGALRAARTLGRRVPSDLSVVGFDDVPAAEVAGLTTVHQPTVEKGRLAGRLLVAQLTGGPAPDEPVGGPDAPAASPLPTRLVVRGSSGPVSTDVGGTDVQPS